MEQPETKTSAGQTGRLAPHQQRVVEEKLELDKKARALSEFIGRNPIFETIDPAEQERLKEQNDIMWQYSEILGARIAAFELPAAEAVNPTGVCGVCGGSNWRGMGDNKRGVIAYACECGHSWERSV